MNAAKWILALCTLLITCGCDGIPDKKPIISGAVMDLGSYDFEKQGPIPISGYCEFYWNRLYSPTELENIKPDYFINIPESWNNKFKKQKSFPAFGYATYRFKILNAHLPLMSVYVPNQDSAYRMWINGKIVSENGKVGKSRKEMIPQRLPDEIFVDNTGYMDFVIQVSNYNHRWGGMGNQMIIGSPSQIVSKRKWDLAYQLFVLGAIFITSIYHIFIFFTRRQEKTRVLFGLLCLLLSIRVLFTGDYLIYQIFPGFNWELGLKIEFLSLYFSIMVFFFFIFSLYKGLIPSVFQKINYAVLSAASGVVIIFPAYIFSTYSLNPFLIYSLVYESLLLVYLIKALMMKKDGVIFILTGLSILLVSYIFDILASNEILPQRFQGPFSPMGAVIFIFLQSMLLAVNFSKTYARLDELSAGLENEVKKQTEELIKANMKLKELDSAKTDFFANLNHELRTPVTLILSPLDSIIKGSYGKTIKTDDDLLKIILKNCYKLNKKVDDILDFIKIDENRMTLRMKAVTINELIRQYHDELGLLMKSKDIDFDFIDSAGKKIVCRIDRYLFETAFMNLASNSFKFTDRGGKISVILESDGINCILKFKDNGRGIPPEKMDSIFDRFNNADYGKSGYGSGLGLSLTKRIIMLHGGGIEISKTEEEGSCFIVRIPVSGQEELSSENTGHLRKTNLADFEFLSSSSSNSDMPHMAGKYNLLIVDDNADILSYLEQGLKNEFNVFTAGSVGEAKTLLKDNMIDIALSDLMMEPEDGWDFLQHINSSREFEHIPVIFLTARNVPDDRMKSLRKGVVDYITKPFLLEELNIKIENVLKRENRLKSALKDDLLSRINGIFSEDKRKQIETPGLPSMADIFKEKKISAREGEIINLIISGYQYKEISGKLGISTNTVANHITKIYGKLGIQNRIELLNMFSKGIGIK
jgi:two-component system, sensor histidine kinase ChiS